MKLKMVTPLPGQQSLHTFFLSYAESIFWKMRVGYLLVEFELAANWEAEWRDVWLQGEHNFTRQKKHVGQIWNKNKSALN